MWRELHPRCDICHALSEQFWQMCVRMIWPYPNTTTDPENVQPLNGKQQGVLDVEGAASPGMCSSTLLPDNELGSNVFWSCM